MPAWILTCIPAHNLALSGIANNSGIKLNWCLDNNVIKWSISEYERISHLEGIKIISGYSPLSNPHNITLRTAKLFSISMGLYCG